MNISLNPPLECRTGLIHTPRSGASAPFLMQQMMMQFQQLLMAFCGAQVALPSLRAGRGAPSQRGPGLEGFLGRSPGMSRTFTPRSELSSRQASPTSLAAQSNSGMSARLMESIRRSPVPPRCRPGYCYRGVKHHLRQVGVNLTGGSAYMAADQLAATGRFREVQVPPSQLRTLPAGAVVVWDRGPGKPHGHISIAMGDGREASDRIRPQITRYASGRCRVFIPS